MKKYIIIIMVIIVISIITYFISFHLSQSNISNNSEEIKMNNNIEISNDSINEKQNSDDGYENIKVTSNVALELFEYVPKYFQSELDRMSGEYILFSVLSNLNKNNTNTAGGREYTEYSYEEVNNEIKIMFGENTEIEVKEVYDYPISYNSSKKLFHIIPFGISNQEYQVIKDLKENSKEFILELYMINIEYDFTTENSELLIDTKETFKQYAIDRNDLEALNNTRIIKEYNGEKLNFEEIVEQYSMQLPVVRYTIIKKDDSGKEYYIDNINVIY